VAAAIKSPGRIGNERGKTSLKLRMSQSAGMGVAVALPVYHATEPLRADDGKMKSPG
jgi:hypothetical protein